MPVNTDDALLLTAGHRYSLSKAIERMQRKAIGRMTQLATIYRPLDVVGGVERLQEDAELVAADVPCVVEGWRMPNEQTQNTAYTYEISDKKGHFPLGTDLRRNDYAVIDNIAYNILGLQGPTGNLVELVVLMRASFGHGDGVMG